MLKVSDLHSYTLHGLTQLPLLKPVSFNCTIGTAPKYMERQVLTSLALCVHLDTTPVNIKVSGEQVSVQCTSVVNFKINRKDAGEKKDISRRRNKVNTSIGESVHRV